MDKEDFSRMKRIIEETIDEKIEPLRQLAVASEDRMISLEDKMVSIEDRIISLEAQSDYIIQKMDQNHREIKGKIQQVITMESEDIKPLYKDVKNLKVRVEKLEKAKT